MKKESRTNEKNYTQIWNSIISQPLFNWSIHLPVPAKIRYLLSLSHL